MNPKLTKRELLLLMEILNPRKHSDYGITLRGVERLQKNGFNSADKVKTTADKAYDKLRTEYLKRTKE